MLRKLGFAVSTAVAIAPFALGCSTFFPSNDNPPPPPAMSWDLHAIRVDSVGYLPDRQKVATVVLPAGMTALTDVDAEVRSAANDSVVWTCTLTGPSSDAATGITYYLADFTGFTELGDFYVAAPGLGGESAPARSAPFQVSADLFRDPLSRSMLGMYGQRCDASVSISLDQQTWSHGKCHTGDAYLDYLTGKSVVRPSLGGWHDAGDYGKYVTNGAFAAGTLLMAWEHFQPTLAGLSLAIPEHGGPLPDFLAEVKWELDWLLTTQDADGGVPHKLTALDFEGFVMPQQDGQRRYFTPVGTAATGDLVAVLAQASRIYRPYDPVTADKYIAAARLGYGYLAANTGPAVPAMPQFSTGSYGQSSDQPNRLWAAAELWETTAEAPFLADLEALIGQTQIDLNFDWDNVENLGLFTYLLSIQAGRSGPLVAALTTQATTIGDQLVAQAAAAAFGRDLDGYWWGSNGAVARTAMNLWVAYQLNNDSRYLDAIALQLDHLLGRNIYDRSQVTALGYHPPANPHHRPSLSDGIVPPWPGLLVGGSDSGPLAWVDDANMPDVNEVAINWNAAFVYATAALTPPASSTP